MGGWLAATLGAFTGCSTIHEVMVDALNNPAKPLGTSYHLEVHDPSGGVDPALGAAAIANGKDALAARGLYEAQANAKPDMIIDLEYGVGPGQIKIVYRARTEISLSRLESQEPAAKPVLVFEKYLQLTAREPATVGAAPARARPRNRGDELWSVRVSVEDQKKELAPYLPVLASVSVEYIGRNSGAEKHFEVDAGKAAAALRHPKPEPPHKSIRHQQFNSHLIEEVVPFIHSHCAGCVPIITTGASFGALHSANTLFRRPDLIDGCIALSGSYDLKDYTNGYWDENVYFNSPIDYLPGLNDEGMLAHLRAKQHIHFVTGQGNYEKPSSVDIGHILAAKHIPHTVDLWGHDVSHDWPWWRQMLPHYLGTKF